jgi:acyl carrier protein
MTGLDECARELIGHLLAVKPTLRADDIHLESSVTDDLGFDSIDLVRLATRIRGAYPDFNLEQWLEGAMTPNSDSVASMAAVLADTRRPAPVNSAGEVL